MAAAGVLAAAGFVLIVASTQGDPGVTVDSGSYLAVADGIRSGHGPTSPVMHYGEPYPAQHRHRSSAVVVTHFPPLYPAVIAGVRWRDRASTACRPPGGWVRSRWRSTVAWVTILVGQRTQSVGLALLGGGMVHGHGPRPGAQHGVERRHLRPRRHRDHRPSRAVPALSDGRCAAGSSSRWRPPGP